MPKPRLADKVAGRTAIVTGAASGIGAAITDLLTRHGAHVIAVDVDPVDPDTFGGSQRVIPVGTSVTSGREMHRAIDSTLAASAHIDLVFNCAAIDETVPFEDFTDEEWRAIIEVNLLGAMDVTRAVYSRMLARGSGRIIHIASAAGVLGFPFGAPYTASKAGLIGFVRALHAEARSAGVHIGVICLGFVDTPLLWRSDGRNADRRKRYLRSIPGQRLDADRAAEAIVSAGLRSRCVTTIPASLGIGLWLTQALPGLAGAVRAHLARLYRRA